MCVGYRVHHVLSDMKAVHSCLRKVSASVPTWQKVTKLVCASGLQDLHGMPFHMHKSATAVAISLVLTLMFLHFQLCPSGLPGT